MVKMCERVVTERWMNHLEENAVITRDQFGFRNGGSCVTTNLVCFYSRMTGIIEERDGWVDAVYLDLKENLIVPHKRLL